MSRELALLALRQLEAWTDLAFTWPLRYQADPGTTAPVIARCAPCDMALYHVTDRYGKKYHYQPDNERAMIVAHLRNVHRDLEPFLYAKHGIT